jgi:hypothetical protein
VPLRRTLSPVRYEIRAGAAAAGGLPPERRPGPSTGPLPPHPPLFPARLAPSLLTALVNTETSTGEVDVDALVEVLATRRFPAGLPTSPGRSLVRGAQLLVDVGPAMGPFRRDVEQLAAMAVDTIGHPGVRRLHFADSPLRGVGTGARRTWSRAYVPPAPGTPVLVLSELGIGGPVGHHAAATPEEWLLLHELLERRGSPFVALVPYPPARWPRPLVGRVPIVTWDRGTTLVQVRDAVTRRGRARHD